MAAKRHASGVSEDEVNEFDLAYALWQRRTASRRINVAAVGGVGINLILCFVATDLLVHYNGNWAGFESFIVIFSVMVLANGMAWIPLGVMLIVLAGSERILFRLVPAALGFVLPFGMLLMLKALNRPFEADWAIVLPSVGSWIMFLVAMLIPPPRTPDDLKELARQVLADEGSEFPRERSDSRGSESYE